MKKTNKIIRCSAAIAAALTFSVSTQAQNLLVNGDFETSPAGFTANPITVATVNQGWATFGGDAGATSSQNDMSSSSDSPKSGSFALLETVEPGNNWSPAGAYQIVSGIIPGQTYTLNLWALTDTANDAYASTAGVLFQLGFDNSSLTQVGTTTSPDPGLPTEHTWTLFSATATAPVGASDAFVYLMFQDNASATAPENLFYDNVSLTAAPEPSTLALAGMGGVAALSLIRRRKI